METFFQNVIQQNNQTFLVSISVILAIIHYPVKLVTNTDMRQRDKLTKW